MKRALITGITGQDGSYLAEMLLAKGYDVHGIIRRSSSFNTARIDHVFHELHLHHGDLTDGTGIRRVLEAVQPDEVYNLAAQSHVRVSFDQAEYTADVVALGTLRLLEAVRDMKAPIRFYQAGSSEMFGSSPAPQNEETPFRPRSPYAVSKVAAHGYCRNYREAYGMFIACGILMNHESPRRGETFVTRKITRGMTRYALGLQGELSLGNLDARRDWGYAGDYVDAMWRMLQADEPDDFVIATGRSHTVREFLVRTAQCIYDSDLCCLPGGPIHVPAARDVFECIRYDARYDRPTEVDHLQGDASKAARVLGWAPTMSFGDLVAMMVSADMKLAQREKLLKESGHASV